jgi:hypothetical protein
VLASSVSSIAHHFLKAEHAYKLQPGGPGYETVYATTSVIPYLLSLTPANDLAATFDAIAAHEVKLVTALLSYLMAPEQVARGLRVVGVEEPSANRLPTVSFVIVGDRPMRSKDVVKVFDERGGVGASSYTLPDLGSFFARLESDTDTFTRIRSRASCRRRWIRRKESCGCRLCITIRSRRWRGSLRFSRRFSRETCI